MKKKFHVELYYFLDEYRGKNLMTTPDLDLYQKNTKSIVVITTDWEIARSKILNTYSDIAYIHCLDTTSVDY